jgi:uncharacterized protein
MRFLDTSRIRTRFNELVAAPDGIELSVDLYLPARPGRYPVLLNRTPADNNRNGRAGFSIPPAERWKAFAAQGYIVAAADVRGRGDSQGQFIPFVHEGVDGAATVAWLRELEECNGKVGVFGSGYAAFCAWAAAVVDGHIDGVASISPFGTAEEGLIHRNGAVRLDWLFWMHLVGGRAVQPAAVPPWKMIYRHSPLQTMDEALGRSDIWWRDWLEHLDRGDPYWNSLQLANPIARHRIPGLHITGWWDAQLGSARYYYKAAERSNAPQSLIIGPWDSTALRKPRTDVGGFNFGIRSLIDVDETLIQFFGAQLRGEKNVFASSNTRLFMTGRNEWCDGTGWPGNVSKLREFYLSSNGAANTRRGDGILTDVAPCQAAIDEITHNPSVPVHFQANFESFAATQFTLNLDQAHVTSRDEALVYTSAPVVETLFVYGRPRITLTVRTRAPDADVYVMLSDIFPLEARDFHLAHVAVRLATIKGFQSGIPSTLTLELNEVVHEFLPGHRLRLTITPSLFPLYARNLQQPNYLNAAEPQVATIELLHGLQSRAKLYLPTTADVQSMS